MITITKPTYKCEHCKKHYMYPKNCAKHETRCTKNPENWRDCANCEHCIMKDGTATIYHADFAREVEETVESYWCEAKKVFMHPPKIEHANLAYKFEGFDNLPMPKIKECDKFELIKKKYPEGFFDDAD